MGRSFLTSCADLSQLRGEPRPASREQLVAGLREQLGQWAEAEQAQDPQAFSCGAAAVDRLLPGGGLRHGMVVEWMNAPVATGGSLAEEAAATKLEKMKKATGESPIVTGGAATLGLLSAREACREGGVLVVVDRARMFYPPAAAAWGIDLERLIVVWPHNVRNELWAAVQALRSPMVAAMWAPIERLDSRAFRRLQLAAEAGRTLGVLVRPAAARGQPSWADVRLEVSPLSVVRRPLFGGHGPRATGHGRYIQVHNTHCRGGRAGGLALVEIDDVQQTVREASLSHDTHSLPVVTELGDSASHSHSARA